MPMYELYEPIVLRTVFTYTTAVWGYWPPQYITHGCPTEFAGLEVWLTGLSQQRVCAGEMSVEERMALPTLERSDTVEKMD